MWRPVAPATRQEIDAALGALSELDAHRIVIADGAYVANLSTVDAAGLAVASLASALARGGGHALKYAGEPGQRWSSPSTPHWCRGAVVRIAEGAELAKPILLVLARAGSEPRLITVRNMLDIGAGAQATVLSQADIVLPGAAAGQANAVSEIAIGEGANLLHVKCTLDGTGSTHLASWQATLAAGATYRPFQLTAGTGLVRNHLAVTFAGERGKLDLAACFLGRGAEHIDTTLVIDHAVPGACTSRELVKGVLADRARGVVRAR